MLELLLTLNRVVVAFASGAVIMVGTAYLADVLMPSGSVFDEIASMLRDAGLNPIFLAVAGLTTYSLGVLNCAAATVVARRLTSATENELLLINRIETLQRPQVLKEVLDLLFFRRTLIAFCFPLAYFGAALAADYKEASFSHPVRILAGLALMTLACLAPVLASRITRLLERTASKLVPQNSR